jgi:class 3 adenylate cyclase/tetratricopeptide (TPR) repeat protein
MHCPSCGFENSEGLKFCNECGAPLLVRCAQCGFTNQPQAKFCGACGVALPPQARASTAPPLSYTPDHLAEKILHSKTALEGERKQVTVLFADLKGSMELLADRDPEDARAILDPVLERMIAAVHRYEGTVNQVMGDGIIALFGAPLAHEDHAVRACYAALAMQAALRRYSEEVRRTHGLTVDFRVGLNSGEVVVRAIDNDLHMDYSAIGQTVHLAARMEQLAMPGSILITPDVLRLAEGYVQVTSLGPLAMRGLRAPVEVYELLGAGPVRTRLQAAAVRGLTRFVGRDRELGHLYLALEWAGSGHGQVVALVGEPGVGKSRLVEECLHSPRTRGWVVLESASISYGKATPYLPVIELLKGYCGIDASDDPPRRREKVLGTALGLDEALRPILPPILALLEVPVDEADWQRLDPAQRRQRTLEALKRLLLRESQRQPLFVVFEDLHWIDAETQAFLDSLVESLPTAHVLLLVNYRLEYQHGWGGKAYYTQVRLDPLPSKRADELLQALLGDDARLAPLKRFFIERTAGNPFFLEESVRTLLETQVLIGGRGVYRLAKDIRTIQVPATVQAVLAARIDRLPPEEKRLLQTAAVIGTDVPLPLLQAIAELPEAMLHRGLAHLQAAEFLYETRLFPEPEYTFKHALTHEVAYGSLLQERRRTVHARIVEALEGCDPARLAEQIERLAHHAVRGEVWEKAVTYGQQVGDKALDRGACGEAVTGYEQALDALGHLPETPNTRVLAIELRYRLAGSLRPLRQYQRSLALLDEAEVRARQLDNRTQLGWVLSTIAWVRRALGDLEGAMTAARQALEMADTLGDPALQAVASYRVGQASFEMGDFGRAAEVLRGNVEALACGTYGLAPSWEIHSRAWLAWSLSVLGEFAEGRRHGKEALRLSVVEGRWDAPMAAHACLGLLYLTKGDIEASVRVLEQAVALGRASDDIAWVTRIAGGLGEAYARAGRLAEGLSLLEEARRDDIHAGVLLNHGFQVMQLSTVTLLAGRLAEAWQYADQALTLARQQQARGIEAHALFQLGTVYAHASPPDTQRAEELYREALTLAEELSMRPLQAHCHRGLGTLYTKIGHRDQARAELSIAIELYKDMDMTFWLSQAEATRAQVEGR